MKLEWKDADDVVARLGEEFMKPVLANSGRGSSVQFGLTGSGQFPNYQVKANGRDTLLFAGLSHKEWTRDLPAFDRLNLSQEFPFDQLYTAFTSRFRAPLKGPSPAKR